MTDLNTTDKLTDELTYGEPVESEQEFVTVINQQGDVTRLAGVENDWTPMRSDAAEIEYRFAQSTQRLRELRAQKQNLFDLIRDEVIANNRLSRAAKIYNIDLEADDGNDDK